MGLRRDVRVRTALPIAPTIVEEVAVSPAAFDELFRLEAAGLTRVASLLLDDPTAAADVVQDAFVQVLRRFDDLERPGAYLRTCVVNACHNANRSSRRGRRALQRLRPEAASYDAVDELGDALAGLTERQRSVIVLRYHLDLSEAAIAEALGIRPGTVRSTLHAALANLRKVLP